MARAGLIQHIYIYTDVSRIQLQLQDLFKQGISGFCFGLNRFCVMVNCKSYLCADRWLLSRWHIPF